MTPSRLPLFDRVLLRLLRGPGAEFVVGDIVERHADDLAAGVEERRARRRLRRQVLATLWSWYRPGRGRAGRSWRAAWGGAPADEDGGGGSMGTLAHDLRAAARSLARRPAFALGVASTLGLGIGAATTIYSVVDAIVIRPLDYDRPGELVAVGTTFPGREWVEGAPELQQLAGTSVPNYLDIEERARSFASLAAAERWTVLLPDLGDGPELVSAAAVTPGFLHMLGASPALGRAFRPGEYEDGAGEVFLLSHGAWVRRFGSDPAVVGRPLDRVGTSATIVGVLPEDFEPPEAFFSTMPELWAPMAAYSPRYASRGRRSAFLIGRLAPGVDVEQARAEATAIAAELARDFPEGNVYPDGSWFGIGVNGLREHTIGSTPRVLWVFLAASAVLLLLATLNAATLLLARALDRARELGVRVALGAGRLRVVRLLLMEAVLLAVGGGLLGVALATAGVGGFLRLAPTSLPRTAGVGVDGRVLAAAALASLVTGVMVGLLPALRLTAPAPWSRLQRGGRGASAPGSRLRAALVSAQVSAAVVLLCGAGLLGASFWRIVSVEPGFAPEGLLSLNVPVKRPGAPEGEEAWQAWDAVLAEVSSVAGVAAVAGTTDPPFADPSWAPRLLLPGDPPETWRQGIAGYSVTPGYFGTVGTRLVQGRDFGPADGVADAAVAIVNESFVRTQLEGREALGAEIVHADGDARTTLRVVGVVEDVVQTRAEDGPRPAVYVPYTQVDWPWVVLVVRSTLPADALVPELRRAVARFSSFVPPRDVRTLEDRMAGTRTTPRFQALLIGVFALVALVLAAVGLYGSLAHEVGRRRRELGVRMALGADRPRLVRAVLTSGMRVVGAGLAVGIGLALASNSLLAAFLFEVRPGDPRVLLGVAVLLVCVSAVACLVPARRATGVDPVTVLSAE